MTTNSLMPESLTVATTETVALVEVATRLEHDLLGEREVPETAYWGVHTLRAVENFPITGVPVGHFPELVKALAMVKQAAARANRKLGQLPRDKAEAIDRACDALMSGHFVHEFVVDAIQGGAGTSTNMNANEVIANVALELVVPDLTEGRQGSSHVFPKRCKFLSEKFPTCSVIRPSSTDLAGAQAAAAALTASNLFKGQPPAFFQALTALAKAADGVA